MTTPTPVTDAPRNAPFTVDRSSPYYLGADGRTVYVRSHEGTFRAVGEVVEMLPDGLVVQLTPELPGAFEGTVRQVPEACPRPPTCATCRRCRAHCRCTAGVDVRGSR